MTYSKEMDAAVEAAKESGKILMQLYGHTKAHFKADHSIITKADLLTEKKIKAILSKRFKDYNFYGEESGMGRRKSRFTWVVDPLDGTTNYTIKNPFFCTSIALADEVEPVLGVVYNPATKELFTAQKGKGAFLNGKRMHVSNKAALQESLMTFCHSNKGDSLARMVSIFGKLKHKTQHFRQIGAAALELSYLGAGRVEAFVMPGTNPWDVAAGALIVSESGGKVTNFKDKGFNINSNDVLASNSRLHDELLKVISE
jgi:myo-inositol-1(or 4)-monophosphatase